MTTRAPLDLVAHRAVTEVLRAQVTLSLDELSWLGRAWPSPPSELSPAGFVVRGEAPSQVELTRGAIRLVQQRLAEMDASGQPRIRPAFALALDVCFAPLLAVDVQVSPSGGAPSRGIFWSDGELVVQAMLAPDGFHLSMPVRNAAFADWLARKLAPADAGPEPRSLPREAFRACSRVGYELGIGPTSRRWDLAALVGPDVLALLLEAELLVEHDDRIAPAPEWRPMWNALAHPDACTVTVRAGADDPEPATVALLGPPGARVRLATPPAPDADAAVDLIELWWPGEAGLAEELRASLLAPE